MQANTEALRDAVIEAFRFDRQDVARIATPALLDDLARTSLGLRFGDPAFGRHSCIILVAISVA
ncbi:hypothetical protein HG437_001240 [Candidatus Saccharibacteria bacterium]|nr:hypothetical protein [Candidatus Saccharibacteria bacterium]